eukprot:Clim_evm24s159 gene=Clim_evmTU24s159
MSHRNKGLLSLDSDDDEDDLTLFGAQPKPASPAPQRVLKKPTVSNGDGDPLESLARQAREKREEEEKQKALERQKEAERQAEVAERRRQFQLQQQQQQQQERQAAMARTRQEDEQQALQQQKRLREQARHHQEQQAAQQAAAQKARMDAQQAHNPPAGSGNAPAAAPGGGQSTGALGKFKSFFDGSSKTQPTGEETQRQHQTAAGNSQPQTQGAAPAQQQVPSHPTAAPVLQHQAPTIPAPKTRVVSGTADQQVPAESQVEGPLGENGEAPDEASGDGGSDKERLEVDGDNVSDTQSMTRSEELGDFETKMMEQDQRLYSHTDTTKIISNEEAAKRRDEEIAKQSRFFSRFMTTKSAWRGKYKRIFAVGWNTIATVNPATLEITNVWPFKDEFVNITPSGKSTEEFTLHLRKGAGSTKTTTLTFLSPHRADILTDCQRFRSQWYDQKCSPVRGFEVSDKVWGASFVGFKYGWKGRSDKFMLRVNAHGLQKVTIDGTRVVSEYLYKDIVGIHLLDDVDGIVVVTSSERKRLHIIEVPDQRNTLLQAISDIANKCIGISIPVLTPMRIHDAVDKRLGAFAAEKDIISVSEFIVHKALDHVEQPVRRVMGVSRTCIVERNPSTYDVITTRPLDSMLVLVRPEEDPQKFTIQYRDGSERTYVTTGRDTVLASMLDAAKSMGNINLSVQMGKIQRGNRIDPFHASVDQEMESLLMKSIIAYDVQMSNPNRSGLQKLLPDNSDMPIISFESLLIVFNANVDFAGLTYADQDDKGLFATPKDKLIQQCAVAVLNRITHILGDGELGPRCMAEGFCALRRLSTSKAGFETFTQVTPYREAMGRLMITAMKYGNAGAIFAAVDCLIALIHPMHHGYDLYIEQMNKSAILSSPTFVRRLLMVLSEHARTGSGDLVVSSLLDFFTFACCMPYSETTLEKDFKSVLRMIVEYSGRAISRLFNHPSTSIVRSAGLLTKAAIEEGDEATRIRMQNFALSEGSFLQHLCNALFLDSQDRKQAMLRELSLRLLALWTAGSAEARSLCKRVFPLGLILFLQSEERAPDSYYAEHVIEREVTEAEKKNKSSLWQHWADRLGFKSRNRVTADGEPVTVGKGGKTRTVVLRKPEESKYLRLPNWGMLCYQAHKNHTRFDLIWNQKTRQELREGLELELRTFHQNRETSGMQLISWNYREFEVVYPSLKKELRIGSYYLRVLLDAPSEDDAFSLGTNIQEPRTFFNDLYHRFLLAEEPGMKSLALKAMTVVYAKCSEEIGTFNDSEHFVRLLNLCGDRILRDRLLLFIEQLLLSRENAKLLISAGGVKTLVDLMTLAHGNADKTSNPLPSNLIETNMDADSYGSKEWYYRDEGDDKGDKYGPISISEMSEKFEQGDITARTKLWAQGMAGWKRMEDIVQLRWKFLCDDRQGVMAETDMAALCLRMLTKMVDFYPTREEDGSLIRPIARVKRVLCDAECLPHICQILLTFAPKVVESATLLLDKLMDDNPSMPTLYHTGVFFFALMYTGSNVLGLSEFLSQTHKSQTFRVSRAMYADDDDADTTSSELETHSILNFLLPKALVMYLDHHGPKRFAEAFLGDFDNPEVIWNHEMRRHMINRIALHISEYTPRLRSNSRAIYRYHPIPTISYPTLEDELFCGSYYLKHLCDTVRFPDWPIRDPVTLLREILEAWRTETNKKGGSMNTKSALNVLGIDPDSDYDERKIRRAYFKLAAEYHPDKNPDGREMFNAISDAYDFLCSNKKNQLQGPDPKRIKLLLKAQALLFKQHRSLLKDYKYAGYAMLIKTLAKELEDPELFTNPDSLLSPALEVVRWTLQSSQLNVIEFHQGQGVRYLVTAMEKCMDRISIEATEDMTEVPACANVMHSMAACAGHKESLVEIAGHPVVVRDTARCAHLSKAPSLQEASITAMISFSRMKEPQEIIYRAGALWYILPLLFKYDFTLDESGIDKSKESNRQEVNNHLARLSVTALYALSGLKSVDPAEVDTDNLGVRAKAPFQTPTNAQAQVAMYQMLTPAMIEVVIKSEANESLKTMNSNSESPYLIWNSNMRTELVQFCETMSEQSFSRSQDETLADEWNSFQHRGLGEEPVIGNVYIRLYNRNPSQKLTDVDGFTHALLAWLGTYHAKTVCPSAPPKTAPSGAKAEGGDDDAAAAAAAAEEEEANEHRTALEAVIALKNVWHYTPVENLILPSSLYSLLELLLHAADDDPIPRPLVEAFNYAAGHGSFAALIEKDRGSVPALLYTMRRDALNTGRLIQAIAITNANVTELMRHGGHVYLLHQFVSSTDSELRQAAATAVGRLVSNRLIGPKILIACRKFLPSVMVETMAEGAEQAVALYESDQENPELIWNSEAREAVNAAIGGVLAEWQAAQAAKLAEGAARKRHGESLKALAQLEFAVPDSFECPYARLSDDFMVAGVYIGMFIRTPSWTLRQPKEFLKGLLDEFVIMAERDDKVRDLIATALMLIVDTNQTLRDQVAVLGAVPGIFGKMTSSSKGTKLSALEIANKLCESPLVVESTVQFTAAEILTNVMATELDHAGIAADTLRKIVARDTSVSCITLEKLRAANTVPVALRILEQPLADLPNASTVKAQIVKFLKELEDHSGAAERFGDLFKNSDVWALYNEQNHEMFITSNQVGGYLTSGLKEQQKFITQSGETRSASAAIASEPPPMDDDDSDDDAIPHY